MTKDEALDLALEALEKSLPRLAPYGEQDWLDSKAAITAIKQALAAPVQPVAWKWHQAPVKTQWGDDMVVADLAIGKDHTVSIYCERDQTVKVEAMFNPPAAQPAVPDALTSADIQEHIEYVAGWNECRAEMLKGMKL